MSVTARLRVSLGFLALAAALSSGCGGGGGGDDVAIIDVDAQGRVVLGTIGDATVRVFRVGDYSTPVATATTSTGATLPEIGSFAFSIADVPENALFLLVVTGGSAYDSIEDGVLDPPVTNLGTVHALATAAELDAGPIHVSAVTEIVYQRVRYFLQALYDETYVTRAADSWSSFVLRDDLTGDAAVDLDDALAFDDVVDAGALFRPYAAFHALVILVLGNGPVTEEAFALSREELRFLDLTTNASGLDLVGNLAYVAHQTDGLDIYDVSDPLNPTLLGTYDTPGSAVQVQVVGTLAYVADNDSLQIVDVSNPASPTLAGSVATGPQIVDVRVVGNRAYLADDAFGAGDLIVVDVTNPATASILGSEPVTDGADRVRVQGSFAYVLGQGHVETFDVSDPANPSSEGTVATEGFFSVMDLALGHLFVAAGGSFEVFDLDSPSSPDPAASIAQPAEFIGDLRVVGTRAYVSGSFDGVVVIDVSNPSNPVYLGIVPASGTVNGVDVEDNLIVTTESNGGLNTIAGGTPVPSGVVEEVVIGNYVNGVDSVGNRVYATMTGPAQLVVFDSTSPLALTQLGAVDLVHNAFVDDMDVEGTTAFVVESEIQGYAVSNPAAPAPGDGDDTLGGAFDIDVAASVAYTGAPGDGLGVYSVSGATIAFATSIPVSGFARGVAYDGSAIVLCTSTTLVTFDASNPLAPTAAGTAPVSGAIDVALAPPYAFVSDFSGSGIGDQLNVIDYSTLASPTSVRLVPLPTSVNRVVRDGSVVFVSSHRNGINVVDATTPTSAIHVGSIPVPSQILNFVVNGDFLFVATGPPSAGLSVLRAPAVAVP
jgi:hypothetical protein